MMKHIKLYPKFTISAKVKDLAEAEQLNKSTQKMYIHLRQQEYEIKMTTTQRKNKPFNVDISFYELKTLKEMVDDKIREVREQHDN